MDKFIPIILGTDINAYNMARAFHEEYNINSILVGKGRLLPTDNSKIVTSYIYDNLDENEVFVEKLLNLSEKLKVKYENLILIASNENYAKLIVENKEEIKADFIIPFIDQNLMDRLTDKAEFYQLCENHGIDYPKTLVINKNTNKYEDLPFGFPVVLKPSDSAKYFNSDFEGKKKAYIIQDKSELIEIINKIYGSSYDKSLIIQEYIPGDSSSMRVMNVYCDGKSKVKMMSLGRVVLEECIPSLIGNYSAIISDYNYDLYMKYKKFLEAINYKGFANIDIKKDPRDGKYKIFEINVRQGRSSYFTTGAGYNLAKYLVDDLIYQKDSELELAKSEHLWFDVPKGVLMKYSNDNDKTYIKKLLKEKNYSSTLYYKNDFNMKRFLKLYIYSFRKYGIYKKYY